MSRKVSIPLTILMTTCFHTIVFSQIEDMAFSNPGEKIYQQIVDANDKFFTGFYSNVVTEARENVICSPLSAHIVLSSVACGARGATAEEFRTGLHLPSKDSVTHEGFKSLLDSLNNATKIELHLANTIYTQEDISLVPEFLSINSEYFYSEPSRVDFRDGTESAKHINAWVEKQTNKKIKNLIKAESIDESTKVILVNAIYFKGSWAKQFDVENTENRPFYITKDTKRHVPTMFKNCKYPHAKLHQLDAKIIELPYSNEDFSMYVILPNEIEGLRYVEENFNKESMKNVEWKSNKVDLFLPKFRIEFTIDLRETLKKMGMGLMFSNHADFSGMSETQLKIGQVIQKAFIVVNEEGSEAAVATGVQIRTRRLAAPPEEFVINRPFMFTIQHKPSNVIIFAGSIRDLQMLPERDEL